MTITVFIDGLCEPINPGGVAAYGFSVYNKGLETYTEAEGFGEGTGMSNNIAEYQGLCAALKWLLKQHLERDEIVIKSDSRLLVNQMCGFWKCHGGLYSSKYTEAQSLAKSFKNIRYIWIPREENSEADELSRQGYKKYRKFKNIL